MSSSSSFDASEAIESRDMGGLAGYAVGVLYMATPFAFVPGNIQNATGRRTRRRRCSARLCLSYDRRRVTWDIHYLQQTTSIDGATGWERTAAVRELAGDELARDRRDVRFNMVFTLLQQNAARAAPGPGGVSKVPLQAIPAGRARSLFRSTQLHGHRQQRRLCETGARPHRIYCKSSAKVALPGSGTCITGSLANWKPPGTSSIVHFPPPPARRR